MRICQVLCKKNVIAIVIIYISYISSHLSDIL